jgi:MraZ protein
MLPSALRKAVGELTERTLVLTYCRGAIWGMSVEDFGVIEERVYNANPLEAGSLDFAHAFLAPATDVPMDGQGRIRVPPSLRELAHLDREVVVHALLNRVEIWDKARWDERFRASLSRVEQMDGMPGWGA